MATASRRSRAIAGGPGGFRPRRPSRVVGAVAALAAGAALLALAPPAAPAPAPAAAAPAPAPPQALPQPPLHAVVDASARRLAAADTVAAAKWESGAPIEDPAREREVLRELRDAAQAAGLPPEVAERVFRDQIEASKDVQRALHAAWHAGAAAPPPADEGDLAAARQEIDAAGRALLGALADSSAVRGSAGCPELLAWRTDRVIADRELDRAHADGLRRALASVCEDRARAE